jgi:hypothetical protein
MLLGWIHSGRCDLATALDNAFDTVQVRGGTPGA